MVNKNILLNKIGIKSNRTKTITKHVLLSFIYKGGTIAASFLLVPISLNFLSEDSYGVWLTLSSFIGWFAFFDIGIGHGMRNKFAESLANNDREAARSYVSTAYFSIAFIAICLFSLFFISNFFIDWTRVFNVGESMKKELNFLMPIVFFFFSVQLVVKLIATIYTADQRPSIQGKVTFYTQWISVLLIWCLAHFTKGSILLFGSIISTVPVLGLIFLSIIGFSGRYKAFRPNFKFYKKELLKDIFSLGFKFFFIQIAGILLFTTDNFIIAQLFGAAEVVPYNIAYKYFTASNMLFAIIVAPYWSSVTEAYAKGDFVWIKTSMKNLNRISYIFGAVIIFMLLISSFIYKIWVGKSIHIPILLSVMMALYCILNNLISPVTNFINGMGKVKLQSSCLFITAILNIPLCIVLGKTFSMGISGIILATIICLIPYFIITYIQYHRLLNETAKGIWNK